MQIEIFVLGPIENNTIVISCEKTSKAAVIDPSFGALSALEKYLKENNLKLDKILLTHSHWDHIADVQKIKQKYSSPIYVHKLDAQNLENPESDQIFNRPKIDPAKPDFLLNGDEEINIGNISLKVLHTPGHTPGCVCYLNKEEKILFSGDTLFKGSFGRVDFPTSSPNDMKNSLKKLSKLEKDITVIPGHGAKTTIGKESWLEKADEFI